MSEIDLKNKIVVVTFSSSSRNGKKVGRTSQWMNQFIASKDDKAVLIVSGIPLTIKE